MNKTIRELQQAIKRLLRKEFENQPVLRKVFLEFLGEMFLGILEKIFGSKSEQHLKKLSPVLKRINNLRSSAASLKNEEFAWKTAEFRKRIAGGETLDDILPDVYAIFREATFRVLGEGMMVIDQFSGNKIPFMAPYDVQVIGAIVLHQGKIAEMKTGEGKTQAAAMACYLNALTGKGVHVITINGYVSSRDSLRMGKIFNFLGLSVGCLDLAEPHSPERHAAYGCDITFGTSNEFVFDYLRDNMAASPELCVQRELDYAIIDEVDTILIDTARTPFVITGKVDGVNRTFATISFQNLIKMYRKVAGMTGTASTEAAEFLEFYQLDVVSVPTNRPIIRKDHQDMIYKTNREKYSAIVNKIRDVHERGQPVLIGSTSVEKSELLSKLLQHAGIAHYLLNDEQHAGNAATVAQAGRFGIVTIIANNAGRETAIELGGNFEMLANHELQKEGIDIHGLTLEEKHLKFAKLRERISRERKAVITAGGLHVIGTERHNSRRIDNQLRSHSGCQGDPGSSNFFISLDDDLMRIFGAERIALIMNRLGAEEGEVISHPFVSGAIGNAQKRTERRDFEIRRRLKEYDDVLDLQRREIYGLRQRLLRGEDLKNEVLGQIAKNLKVIIMRHIPGEKYSKDWALQPLRTELQDTFGAVYRIPSRELAKKTRKSLLNEVWRMVHDRYQEKERRFGTEIMRQFERSVFLMVIDNLWRDHLAGMDQLKVEVQQRASGKGNPFDKYQSEGLRMFDELRAAISKEVSSYVFRLVQVKPPEPSIDNSKIMQGNFDVFSSSDLTPEAVPAVTELPPDPIDGRSDPVPPGIAKIGMEVSRNDPCPCGSGKKYKKCHGAG